MKKLIFLTILIFVITTSPLVSAHEHSFDEAKQLIESGINCDKLSDDQLEAIGDYYMEQMHPGDAHEMMDKMMGGEGSKSLRQMHITMAKRVYCNENIGRMMGSIPMMNMMGLNNWGVGVGWGWLGWIFMTLFWVPIIIGIIALIKWLIQQSKSESKQESALDILKNRYAKGEIDKKEFEEKKRDLI